MKDLLDLANKYAEGLEKVLHRRQLWLEKYPLVIARLTEIAEFLNQNSLYKQTFYVDKLHAFNEEINGTCIELPSIAFRTGQMPMMVTFKDEKDNLLTYVEEGLKITFVPDITGQILIMIYPHYSNLDDEPAPCQTILIINDPVELTNQLVDQLIKKGLEIAYTSSFTGWAETSGEDEQNEYPIHTNPIGFKRYETTEK